jgi:hypothetical protein
MAPRHRDTETYRDGSGNVWTIEYVVYDSTSGNPGDYDEVIQLKKNGKEVGHITYHKDKSGGNKIPPRQTGSVSLPPDAKRVV